MKYVDFTEPKGLKYAVYEIKKIDLPSDKKPPKDYGINKKRTFKKKRK